jgi:hypothetical protein
MLDVLRLTGLISFFLGGAMFFYGFMGQKNAGEFMFQFIISPILIYLGLKLLF